VDGSSHTVHRKQSTANSPSQTVHRKATGGELSPTRIGNYETGLRGIPVKSAVILARTLLVTPAYLLGIESESFTEMADFSEEQKRLFYLTRQVSRMGDGHVRQMAAMLTAYIKHEVRTSTQELDDV